MSSTTFVDYSTPITATWLNDVNTTVYTTVPTKADLASPGFTGVPTAPTAIANTNTTQLATTAFVIGQAYAPLASPTFTGTPAAPTAVANTNTTQLATTAFVTTAVTNAGKAWQYVSTQTASSSATIDFTGLSGSDDTYMVIIENAVPSADDSVMQMRVSNAGTFQTGASTYLYAGVYVSSIGTLDAASVGANTYIQFTERISNTTSRGGYTGEVILHGATNTASYKRIEYKGGGYRSGTLADGNVAGSGSYQGATAAVDGLRFFYNTGNIASGNFYLYKLRKS